MPWGSPVTHVTRTLSRQRIFLISKAVKKQDLTNHKSMKQISTCWHPCFTPWECTKHCFMQSGSSGAGVQRAGLGVPSHRGVQTRGTCGIQQTPPAPLQASTRDGKGAGKALWQVLCKEDAQSSAKSVSDQAFHLTTLSFPKLDQDFYMPSTQFYLQGPFSCHAELHGTKPWVPITARRTHSNTNQDNSHK